MVNAVVVVIGSGSIGLAIGRRVGVGKHTLFADLRLDPFRRDVYRANLYVRLTRKQFAVLEILMRANGGVVSAETLLEKAWDEHADPFTTAPRVTISTLRKALGEPDLIETVPGVGYRLSAAQPGSDG